MEIIERKRVSEGQADHCTSMQKKEESPMRANLRKALLKKLLGKNPAQLDPAVHAAAHSEVVNFVET